MDDDVTIPAPAGEAGTEQGSELAAELRHRWQRLDPVPTGLAERVVFALEVDAFTGSDLDLELMRLQQPQHSGAGARGDQVRTVTFGSDSLTVMLAISDVEGGHRIDGWVAPGGRREIEVRTSDGVRPVRCDETGRFVLPTVPPGHLQLVPQDLVLQDRAEGEPAMADVAAVEADPLRGAPTTAGGASASSRRVTVTPALTL